MTKCTHCQAEVLSTSQPNRMGTPETLTKALNTFSDFINEPPQYEDKRMVRDYRHELARKWIPVFEAIQAALAATPAVGGEELRDILCAIAAGYKCEGKDDRFIVVENPDFQEDNGSNPKLVIDTWSIAQPASPLRGKGPRSFLNQGSSSRDYPSASPPEQPAAAPVSQQQVLDAAQRAVMRYPYFTGDEALKIAKAVVAAAFPTAAKETQA